MKKPLDELYLEWLYTQVGSVKLKNPARTYWSLLRQLYKKEFVWLVPNDDNRIEDGLDLRDEFIESLDIKDEVDRMWMNLGCSVLEILIGLSRRLSFEADGDPSDWFWHLIETLGVLYSDKDYNVQREGEVDDVLDILIWRHYRPDGKGGLFPLRSPMRDQRHVELWYQLNAYLVELN